MKGIETLISNAIQNVMQNMAKNSGAEEFVQNVVGQIKGRFDTIEDKLNLLLARQEQQVVQINDIWEQLECHRKTPTELERQSQPPLKLLSQA
jgi:hypothetical protein